MGSEGFIRHALMVMSAKPMHKMHEELIRQAFQDNDVVSVFPGTGETASRGGEEGQHPVSGNSMFVMWQRLLTPRLKKQYGDSIEIFLSRQPVAGLWGRMMELLTEQDQGVRPPTLITVLLGSDEEGDKRFKSIADIKSGAKQPKPGTSQELIRKYGDRIQIKVRRAVSGEKGTVGRQEGEISATKMRTLLAQSAKGNVNAAQEFKDNLPSFLSDKDKDRFLDELIMLNGETPLSPEEISKMIAEVIPENRVVISRPNRDFVTKVLVRLISEGRISAR